MEEKRDSLYDISWRVSEPEYRLGEGYSYSTLAKFNREGFDKIHSLFDKVESPSLLFGSMVDTLLTDGQEEFDNKYLVAEFLDLPDSIKNIVESLFRLYNGVHRSLDEIPENPIKNITESLKYQLNWKPETRVKVIKERGHEYYDLLFLSENKTVVSTKDYQEVITCVDILRNNPTTKWYFESNNPFNDSIERFYQLKFKGEFEGIPLRCMMDLVICDHSTKTIIPCDLKTSYKPEWNFYKSYIDWCYYIQASLYWYILRQNLDKHPIYKDYTLLDYRFIVISKGTKIPLIWEDRDTQKLGDRHYGKNKQYYCKDWRTLLKELDIYIKGTTRVPIGIGELELNNLQMWLNNE